MPIKIVSRAEWGAGPPHGSFQTVNWNRPDLKLYVHHTDGATNQAVRDIQRFHQDTRGWTDIGYHFLVREDGTIYEGRPERVRGAHDPNGNEFPAVALIGDYSTRVPTDAQHRAVYEIKDYVKAVKLVGHRDDYPTSCPGDAAYAKIVKGPPPKPEPKPVTYWFEQLKNGKVVRTWGPYQRLIKRNAHWAAVKCGHPKFVLRKFSK
jgi:N-acetylmuramoyl-L-alanine amidase